MSLRRVETREDVIKELYDRKFGNLSEDIQEIIKEIILEDAKKQLKLNMSKYTNTNNLFLINKNISKKKDINKNNYNMNGSGHYNYSNNINMKNIKELCKANQIKLSRVVNGMRIAYAKKELLTKLKKKKII
jgi:hypothetical protein